MPNVSWFGALLLLHPPPHLFDGQPATQRAVVIPLGALLYTPKRLRLPFDVREDFAELVRALKAAVSNGLYGQRLLTRCHTGREWQMRHIEMSSYKRTQPDHPLDVCQLCHTPPSTPITKTSS